MEWVATKCQHRSLDTLEAKVNARQLQPISPSVALQCMHVCMHIIFIERLGYTEFVCSHYSLVPRSIPSFSMSHRLHEDQ